MLMMSAMEIAERLKDIGGHDDEMMMSAMQIAERLKDIGGHDDEMMKW